MQKKSIGLVILLIIIGGILGAAFSQYLSGLFPEGPVKNFFFKAIEFGLKNATFNLGFLTFALSFTFNITAFTALFTVLLLYIIMKL